MRDALGSERGDGKLVWEGRVALDRLSAASGVYACINTCTSLLKTKEAGDEERRCSLVVCL